MHPALDSHDKFEEIVPGYGGRSVEMAPSCLSASPELSDLSQMTPNMPFGDRGLVLCATDDARKLAPSFGPVLEVKPAQRPQVMSVRGRLASPAERAFAPVIGGARLPKAVPEQRKLPEMLLDIYEPEKLREVSVPEKWTDTFSEGQGLCMQGSYAAEDCIELKDTIFALKNAVKVKDIKMRKMCASFEHQLETLREKSQ